jgi:hypothetical protein
VHGDAGKVIAHTIAFAGMNAATGAVVLSVNSSPAFITM